MKTYKIEVIVREGNDEFWESLSEKTGCDEVLEIIKLDLEVSGALDFDIKLVEYKDT